jgi:DNA-binding LacI/PurR family transcriptional regulator
MTKSAKIKNIKELAGLAGVSVGSASMVMGGKWQKKVRPETAERILKIAEEHNYVINPLGRSLQSSQYMRMAVIMENGFRKYPLMGALSFHDLMGIVADRFNEHGYSLDIIQMNREKIDLIIKNRCFPSYTDAIIFLDWDPKTLSSLLRKAYPEQPYVIIGDDMTNPDWTYICRDTEEMSYQVVRHLLRNGHKRIGISRVSSSKTRFELKLSGYMRALAEAGIHFKPQWFIDLGKDSHSLAHGIELARRFQALLEPPTAYYCDDNLDALGMLIELEKMNIDVPGEVEIVGYGDAAIADIATLRLSYLKIPSVEMADFATEYIIDIIRNGKEQVPMQKHFKESLVLQQTTRNTP